MPIADYMAKPIVKTATRAFAITYDPDKPTFQVIFHENWKPFLAALYEKHIILPQYIIDEVERMIACGTLDMGFEVYECPNCHRHHIICYTCKSRFCVSCGQKMTKERAINISKSTLDVKHRHIVFTIDERLRHYFSPSTHPGWLNFLFDAAKEAIFYTFNKQKPIKDRGQSKKKRRRKKKKSTITPGFIITLHTYGRDLKWNPHVHVLCTEGGMDENHVYKAVQYINYESLRKSFMKQLLDKMKAALPSGSLELKRFKRLVNTLYKEDKNGFYVNAPPMKDCKSGKDQVVKYIIRYSGKPAMAQSRITAYDYKAGTISYYYIDHKTNEPRNVDNEPIFRFMLKLLRHIPPPQFKMVRYYGIYATCDHKHKKAMKRRLKRQNLYKSGLKQKMHYRMSMINTFGVDPLLCTCGHYMEFVDSYIPSRFQGGGDPP